MFVFFIFIFYFAIGHVHGEKSAANFESEIFKLQSFNSYDECKEIAAIYRKALAEKVPLPGVPVQSVTEYNISFVIYSRDNNEPLITNTYDSKKCVKNLKINFNKQAVFYVQGQQYSYSDAVPKFQEYLLPKEDVNVIFMDWDSYAFYDPVYIRSITVPRLGNILAKFLRQLINSGTDAKKIYLTGISSGAQALGFAAQQISPRIGKILGLDPVGTCYNFAPSSMRVSPGDADFVQIVHCSEGEFGELASLQGDATFYMNGGIVQPQCLNGTNWYEVNECSHLSCMDYFYETLKDFNRFIGVKCGTYDKYRKKQCNCDDKAVMGYNTSMRIRGRYFVETNSTSESICSR